MPPHCLRSLVLISSLLLAVTFTFADDPPLKPKPPGIFESNIDRIFAGIGLRPPVRDIQEIVEQLTRRRMPRAGPQRHARRIDYERRQHGRRHPVRVSAGYPYQRERSTTRGGRQRGDYIGEHGGN